MRATLFSNELNIGTCELKIGDASMGCLYGELVPNENYSKVRDSILQFNNSSRPDYNVWESLRLNVQLETGYFLLAQGGYNISDTLNFPDPLRIDIAGVNLKILELPADYFTGPWSSLSIAEKLGLENELRKEVQPHDSALKRLFDNEHLLSNATYSAFARFAPSDDVLFEVYDAKTNFQFAVVHLTWTGKRERWPHYPSATYYTDLDDFKIRRMISDNEEYTYDE